MRNFQYIAGKYASNFKAQWASNIRVLWKARKHLDEENLVRREFENVFQGLVKTRKMIFRMKMALTLMSMSMSMSIARMHSGRIKVIL